MFNFKSFIKFLLKRILTTIPVIFGIIVITFFLTKAVPGDPVLMWLPDRFSREWYLATKQKLGLDYPIMIQFYRYMILLFTGDWGYSSAVQPNYPVWGLIMARIPRTFEILSISIIIATYLGIKAGKIAAIHHKKFQDVIIRLIIYLFMAIPGFVIAQWLINAT